MPVDNHIKRMMQDLGQALVQAIASSSTVSHSVERIQQEGYSLYLLLNREQEGEKGAQIELTTRQTTREAVFVLDQRDVAFLKKMGIDATRAGRRQRTP